MINLMEIIDIDSTSILLEFHQILDFINADFIPNYFKTYLTQY